MDLFQAALLLTIFAAVNGIVPVEENQDHSYSSSYDAEEGEHHGKEIGYDLPLVEGSKDEKRRHQQLDDVANKEFQIADKANEPWTAALNHGSMKSEPSAHPYIGIAREPAEFGIASEAVDNGFGFPELVKGGLAFDAGLAKNYELEREAELAKKGLALQAEITSFADEGFAYYPTMELVQEEEIVRGLDKVPGYGTELSEKNSAVGLETAVGNGFTHNPTKAEELVKGAVVDENLEYVPENGLRKPSKKGSNTVPFDVMAAKEDIAEKEKAAWSEALKVEELAESGLLYYPLLAFKNVPFEFKEAELKRETFEKIGELFPAPPKFVVTSHSYQNSVPNYFVSAPHTLPKPEGFAYGRPMKAGFVNGYDTRYI